ncbi:hypothetical protein [Roseateles sp. BYS96W]|uniref:Uncharacterized protein n=1 Tax=Pelomonas nitida TaxID=3299027 RepID=A0ABW7G3Y9_9BURK
MVSLLWSIVGVLLVMWSGVLWLGHALLAVLLGGAGQLPVKELALPEAWTSWLPQAVSESMTQALEAAQPVLQAVAGQLPALAGGIAVLAWVVWALGAVVLLLTGAAAHAGLRHWQRSQRPSAPRGLLPSS